MFNRKPLRVLSTGVSPAELSCGAVLLWSGLQSCNAVLPAIWCVGGGCGSSVQFDSVVGRIWFASRQDFVLAKAAARTVVGFDWDEVILLRWQLYTGNHARLNRFFV